MKENLRIGKIKWFGGWNNKKLRNNNYGVVQYETGEELLRIFEFSDYTRNLDKINYNTLKDKYVISFEENSKKKVLLIKNENTFKNFSSEELIEIIKKDFENNLREPFLSKITLFILKNIMYKNGDFSFLHKNGIYSLLSNKDLFKVISTEEFIKYFVLKEEFFLLYYLEENIPKYDTIIDVRKTIDLFGDNPNFEYEYEIEPKGIDINDFLEKETEKKYQDFKRSCRIVMGMNPLLFKKYYNSTKWNFEFNQNENLPKDSLSYRIYIANLKKNPKKKLEIIKNASIKEVENYIKENIKFKNCDSIKKFIKYITNYEFALELENLFINNILECVEEKLKDCYLIEEYLYYFDGQIIFNKEENNKLYDELRLKMLNKHLKLKTLLFDILLNLRKEDPLREAEKKLCHSRKKIINLIKEKDIFFNRFYFSHIKDENLKLALEKNVLSIYDFKNEKNNVEVLEFLYYIVKTKIPSEYYNYTLVSVPSSTKSEKVGLFNLIKLICLTTGMKNGYNILKTPSDKVLTSKKINGNGIIGNVISNKIKTKYAILFDDVCTSGNTLKHCINEITRKNHNIQIPFCVVFAKTKSKYEIKMEDVFYKEENKSDDSWFIIVEILYHTEYYSFKKIDRKQIENYPNQSYLFRKLLREIVPKEYQAQLCKYRCTFTNIKNEKITYTTIENLQKELDNDLSLELYESLEY